jgi:hypothetical protein
MLAREIYLGLLLAGLALGPAASPAAAGGGGGATSESGSAPSSSGARDSGASSGAAEAGPAVTPDNDQPCPQGQRWDTPSMACVDAATGAKPAPAGQ